MPRARCRTVLGKLFAAVLLVPLVAKYAAADYSFRFPIGDDSTAGPTIRFAAVSVFGSEAGGGQAGSGFVIDRHDGLILSSAHVVSGLNGMAWIAFPNDDDRRYPAKVLIPERGGSLDPDVSVLQLDPALKGLRAMEVQFDAIREIEQHYITGFGPSSPQPLPRKALLTKITECEYTAVVEAFSGDSGSALLSQEGLVVGIAVTGDHGTGKSWAKMNVLPLSCVRDKILELVSDRQNDKIMKIVWTAGTREFEDAFLPPPVDGSGWVSNLRLAKAMLGWIASRTRQISADKKHQENAIKIISERRLGYGMVLDLARAEEHIFLSATQDVARTEIETRLSDAISGLQNTMVSMSRGCSGQPDGVRPVSWDTLQIRGNTAVNALSAARTALATGQTQVAVQRINAGLSELDALVNGLHMNCSGDPHGEDPVYYGRYVAFRDKLKTELQTALRAL